MSKVFIKRCINCGEEFDAARHPNQTTCSSECREVLVRMNRTAPDGTVLPRGIRRCIKCGTVFSRKDNPSGDPKYCSKSCQNGYRNTCRYCKNEFDSAASSEFCSDECEGFWKFDERWDAEQAKIRTCACPACSEPVVRPERFCSDYCRRSTIDYKRITRGSHRNK